MSLPSVSLLGIPVSGQYWPADSGHSVKWESASCAVSTGNYISLV